MDSNGQISPGCLLSACLDQQDGDFGFSLSKYQPGIEGLSVREHALCFYHVPSSLLLAVL